MKFILFRIINYLPTSGVEPVKILNYIVLDNVEMVGFTSFETYKQWDAKDCLKIMWNTGNPVSFCGQYYLLYLLIRKIPSRLGWKLFDVKTCRMETKKCPFHLIP